MYEHFVCFNESELVLAQVFELLTSILNRPLKSKKKTGNKNRLFLKATRASARAN